MTKRIMKWNAGTHPAFMPLESASAAWQRHVEECSLCRLADGARCMMGRELESAYYQLKAERVPTASYDNRVFRDCGAARVHLDQVATALMRAALVAGSKWVRRSEGTEAATVFTVRNVVGDEVAYTFVEERLCYLDVTSFLATFAHYTGEVS